MLFRKKNGQVSIEILAILGVLIIGSIILASFYISNINKKTSEITSLDKSSDNFNNWLNDNGSNSGTLNGNGGNGSGSGTGGAFCGDHIKNGSEQCDDPDLGGETCVTYSNNANASGTLACNSNCTFDTSGCVIPACGNGQINNSEDCDSGKLGGATCASATNNTKIYGTLACNNHTCTFDTSGCNNNATTGYTFDIFPTTGSGFVNKPYTGMDFNLQINNPNTTVDANVTVTTGFGNKTSDCTIDGHAISNGFYHMGNYTNTATTEYNPILDCNNAATYTFTFDTSDNNGASISKDFTFTTTVASDYALCSSNSNKNGSLSICVNNFTATTTNDKGTLQIFVNQPDNKEVTNTSCANNNYGTLCISIGNT